MPGTITVTPQFSDIDSFQHVNFQVFARWFEMGRSPLYQRFSKDGSTQSIPAIMAHHEIDYISEVRYGLDVEIRTEISHIGTKSFHVTQEAYQDGVLRAKGKVVLVGFDFKTRTTIPISEDSLAILKAF